MFISYFEPIYLRERCDLLIHYFYKQINDLGIDEIIYLTNEDYFKEIEDWQKRNCWNLSKYAKKFHQFDYPTNEQLKKAKKEFIPLEIFDDLLKRTNNDKFLAEKILLTEPYDKYVEYFDTVLNKLTKENNIEAIITGKNNPSLEFVAKKYNLPVIHYEIAGLRPFDYHFLAYYDLSGVNGNTSATQEYNKFIKEFEKNKIKLLSNSEILSLMSRNGFDAERVPVSKEKFKIGAALQIWNDSNLIAFSNGYNSEKLINLLQDNFKEEEIIIRNHPSTTEKKLLTFKNIDKSSKAVEFIKKCEKVITINSSVAFEAALYDKPVYILGQSPYEILSENINTINKDIDINKNKFERTIKINFLTFIYLIPYELLFDINYLRYRLTNPTYTELFKYHLDFYQNKKSEEIIDNLKKEKESLENKIKLIENKKENIVEKKKITFLQQIFSVKNEFDHKVWRVFGLKIKKRKSSK